MSDGFLLQSAALFWLAFCFFHAGARVNGIPMTRKTWLEIAQTAAIVVVLFALLTDLRGCTGTSSLDIEFDCVGETWC